MEETKFHVRWKPIISAASYKHFETQNKRGGRTFPDFEGSHVVPFVLMVKACYREGKALGSEEVK
jgi:hypothetical protein